MLARVSFFFLLVCSLVAKDERVAHFDGSPAGIADWLGQCDLRIDCPWGDRSGHTGDRAASYLSFPPLCTWLCIQR